MLSRVAENLYWISRYVERAENVARLLDVGFHLELDTSGVTRHEGDLGPVESVLAILDCLEAFEEAQGAAVGSSEKEREAVLRFLTFDRDNMHSIIGMLARARENARASQETLSGDIWSHLNTFYLYLGSRRAQRKFATSPLGFYEKIKKACVLSAGMVDGTLPRNEVYHFLQLGRHLERVNQVSRILNTKLQGLSDGPPAASDPPMRVVHWSSLLRSCAAYDAYLREHHDRVDPEGVVGFLVLNPSFPRSLRFCVARCRSSLLEISGGDEEGYASEAERVLGRLESDLRYLDVRDIFAQGLDSFLVGIQKTCNQVGHEIDHAYFHA